MGEDWREFRAHLVAQERGGGAATGEMTSEPTKEEQRHHSSSVKEVESSSSSSSGGIFGAISSMFSNKGGSGSESLSLTSKDRARTLAGQVDTATTTRTKKTTKKSDPTAGGDIFDGDDIGGATKLSKIGVSSITSSSSSSYTCSDPFMDEEECALIYDTPNVKLDRHRWAHPLFHVEAGCILVANEKLGGVFHQTVILIIDHNEAAGSTGLVINRPFPGNLLTIASDGESNIDLSLKMAFSKASVAYGGPVMQDQFSALHGFGEVMGSTKVCPGVFVGGSSQLIQEVRRNSLSPTEVLFIKGHAAWVPGQLTREIDKGVWYVAAASADLILRYAGAPVLKEDNPSDLWADILSCMGDMYVTIATAHSGRGDERMLP